MVNIRSITKTQEQKESCFIQNRIIMDYAYYLCNGFFLKQQLFHIIHFISNVSYRDLHQWLKSLLEHGLLIQKQVTSTRTHLYIMNKYALSKYINQTPQNATSIKLNNTKIWRNIYRMELIIELLPKLTGKIHSVEELLHCLHKNFRDIFRPANQESILELYKEVFLTFPIKDKLSDSKLPQGEFANDYLSCTAEYYTFLHCFRRDYENAPRYKGYEKYKKDKELNDTLYRSDIEKNKYCYNLYQMYSNGFFFHSKFKDEKINIGLFDVYTNLQIDKIYRNAIFIMFMLHRYCGFVPIINLTVYVKSEQTKERLQKEEKRMVYDYVTRSKTEYNRQDYYFAKLGVLAWADNLIVSYKVYPLESKYKL